MKMDNGVLIADTHNGFICANAGVGASNFPILANHSNGVRPKYVSIKWDA